MDNTNSGVAQAESKLHFLDYWRIIRIRKTVILAVFLLVVLTTTVVTFFLPQTFMSTVRIQVDKDISNIAPLMVTQQANSYDPYFLQTEFEKIKSQRVLYRVISELKLDELWSKRYSPDTKLTTFDTFQMLKKLVDVQQARNTSLIEIRAYSEDKKEAATIANKVAEIYQQTRLEQRRSYSELGIEALRKEFQSQSDKVDKAQKEVDALRKSSKISDLGEAGMGSTLEPETVRSIERERIKYDSEFVRYNEMLSRLKSMSRQELRKAIPTANPDEQMGRLLSSLAETEQRFTLIVKDLGPENPEVLKLQALIDNINKQIEARVDGVLSGLEAMVSSFRAVTNSMNLRVQDAKKEDADKTELYRPYFSAKRDLETQQRLRDNIYIRILQETVDSKIPKSGVVEIVDAAQVAVKPIRPNIQLNIGLGVVVGLIMGFGLAFFIEYLDTSVKTIDDVERALGAAVIGVIPQNVGSLIAEGADSPHAEAYRVLRTNILFSRKSPEANTITVVSGGAGEGKSTTIFNLATVFAQHGAKVLLVDSDLRRPSLHKILGVTNNLGLTNFLMKQKTAEEVIQTTPHENLNFLPSGKLPSSSMGILNSAAMKEFINAVKSRYDFVFFDSPPIMGVSDASILASSVDMTMLVIQYRKYPQVMTIRAKQMIEKVGGNLLGVVLNNINISQDSYYYYYSGYYYDYYSKNEDSAEGGSKKNGEGRKQLDGGANPAADRGSNDLKQKY